MDSTISEPETLTKSKKVAIVTTLFSPGGIDSFWKYILEQSDKSTLFHVLHQGNNQNYPFDLPKSSYFPIIKWFNFFKSTLNGFRYFNRERPHVVAFNGTIAEHHLTISLWLARLLNPSWSPSVIRIFHSSALYRSATKNKINKLLLSIVGLLYGHNKFVSNAVKKYWGLPGSVAIRRFPRKNFLARPANPGPRKIGFFGRVSFEKGPDRFCDIMKSLPNTSKLQPVVIGDGEMSPQMKRDLPQAHFMGWVTSPGPLLETLDLVLVTSRTEGLGLAYGECLERGIPVLGYNVGGTAELLGDISKIALVPDGDFLSLKNLILEWEGDYDTCYAEYFSKYDQNPHYIFAEYSANLGI